LVQAIRAHVERLDGVFINAGGAVFASFEATTTQIFDEMSNTNVRGAYFVVQALLPLLGVGSTIVFNSSIASRLGQAGTSAYSASKAALTSLGRTLAVDLAPRGIRVNTLSPGPILTPAIAKIGTSEAEQKQLVDRTLLKRWGRAEEVARLARFLLTDDSSFIVGEEIAIDGGRQLT
jgi:NAD(P)-dependent dehydrogenase (short-subunit alcohol dehydrogenase family)